MSFAITETKEYNIDEDVKSTHLSHPELLLPALYTNSSHKQIRSNYFKALCLAVDLIGVDGKDRFPLLTHGVLDLDYIWLPSSFEEGEDDDRLVYNYYQLPNKSTSQREAILGLMSYLFSKHDYYYLEEFEHSMKVLK